MMRVFIQSLRLGFTSATAYRGELIGTALGAAIVMLLNICLWQALYEDNTLIAGLTKGEMLRYVIGAWLLCVFYRTRVDVLLHSAFQDGTLGSILLRPRSLQLQFYAESLGASLCRLVFSITPIMFLVGVGVDIPWKLTPKALSILCLMGLSAHLLAFSLAWCIGILGWLTQHGDGLIRLKVLAVISLGGALIPLPLYPDWLQDVALLLPFSSLSHLPALELAHGTWNPEIIAAPIFWSFLFISAGHWMFQRSVKIWVVQGG